MGWGVGVRGIEMVGMGIVGMGGTEYYQSSGDRDWGGKGVKKRGINREVTAAQLSVTVH